MNSKKTLQECYDKLFTRGHHRDLLSDKGTDHSYIQPYESLLESYLGRPVDFLEIGIAYGACLEMWSEYFHAESNIYGLDYLDFQKFKDFGTIVIGDSKSVEDRDRLFTGKQFDIIVEDGEHKIDAQIQTYKNYFPLVKPNGIYIIEDIQDPVGDYDSFVAMGITPQVLDLRGVKGRYDDVMFIFRK